MKTCFIWLVVVLFLVGIVPNSFAMGCRPKEEAPKVVVKKDAPPMEDRVVVPKPVKPPSPKILKVKSYSGTMMSSVSVTLDKRAASLVRKGASVRIFINYCCYESRDIDANGVVVVQMDWIPPNPSGKIGVAVFQPTNAYGSGYNVCSTVQLAPQL